MTPWWFPSKTEGGAMRADRLAIPIPPGVHWSEARPLQVEEDEAVKKKQPAKTAAKVVKLEEPSNGLSFAIPKPNECGTASLQCATEPLQGCSGTNAGSKVNVEAEDRSAAH